MCRWREEGELIERMGDDEGGDEGEEGDEQLEAETG